MRRNVIVRAAGAAVVMLGAGAAVAGLPAYTLVGTFELPAGTEAFGVGPDGRVVATVSGEIFGQDSVNGPGFSRLGGIDPALVPSFGASFLEVSPDGSRIVIGDNGQGNLVHFVETGALNPAPGMNTATTSVGVDLNFAAFWHDDATLFVTGSSGFGAASFVMEITGLTSSAPSARTVVSNVGGSPGGVSTRNGWLFTGNGFDNGPGGSETGEVRAFSMAGFASTALDFEADGVAVADALSASGLGFDSLGNLLAGGGDFFGSGDAGYAAVIDGDAIGAALAGGGIAPDASELRLVPGTEFDFYSIRANPVTGEVLVSFFGSDTVYRYAVPGPGGAWVFAVGLGVGATRRRRAGSAA